MNKKLLLFVINIFLIAQLSGINPEEYPSFLLVGDTTKTDSGNDNDDTLRVKIVPPIQTESDTEGLVKDSPVVKMLDSLAHIKYFKDYYFTTDTSFLNVYKFLFDEVPDYPDSIYRARIDTLDKTTSIDLTFNPDVKKFISIYAVKKRSLTSRMLGLSEVYFPLFEEQLDRFDIPLELKYLAIVESALNPTAGSRAGAKGLWQFMYGTGKAYGLKVSSYVDDRFDPYKSTIAACEHLGDLFDIYEDWLLVMAAYNSGAGNVNKAIRRSGNVRNYWAIQPFLPRETRSYVPAFIAVLYVMNYASEHNLYPIDPGILYNGIDTVTVKDILSFDQISEMLNVPMDDLKFLNPSYKLGVLPSTDKKQYVLRLPKEYIGGFINNEQILYNYKTKKGIEREKLLAEVKKARERKYHVVRNGENLGLIAQRYRCRVSDLKRWNGLRRTTIYPGQRLIVYTPSGTSTAAIVSKPHKTGGTENVHVVKSGETLGVISKWYGCSVNELKRWNNLNKSTIHPNQKLYVRNPALAQSGPSNSTVTTTEKGYVYHTVKKGETLWDIANLYNGVTVSKIKSLNNITNVKRIQPGQKIKISKTG